MNQSKQSKYIHTSEFTNSKWEYLLEDFIPDLLCSTFQQSGTLRTQPTVTKIQHRTCKHIKTRRTNKKKFELWFEKLEKIIELRIAIHSWIKNMQRVGVQSCFVIQCVCEKQAGCTLSQFTKSHLLYPVTHCTRQTVVSNRGLTFKVPTQIIKNGQVHQKFILRLTF